MRLREDGLVRVDDLAEELAVSPATIRRDLEELESKNELRRVHGGAVRAGGLMEEPLFDDKTSRSPEEKKRIASEAVKLIHPDASIYIDGGSTLLELARLLRDWTQITVVTNSLRAAYELASGGPRLILVGGELRRRSQTMVGPLTRCLVEEIHLDQAFMGTIGLDADAGLTTTDPGEAFTKREVTARAREVILLADSSKIGAVSFAHSGGMEHLDRVITDRGAPASFTKLLKKKGIQLTRA
ncbi:DeoR family transcriptional regulator [Kiritimatiella glycovorans]|uniref:DeoR family transcriptional regulator n=2 Tax=Kiritimatiella glycovorans TaxID=1307763 RepID=A0A0G3EGX7_9BACT|nr:DeoR family transcriptional regulator [Kiritimatiella glycovorans]